MKYCPDCKTEYEDGIEKCADCDVELVDQLPTEEEAPVNQEELVVVYEAADEYEAKIVLSALEAAGIKAWQSSDDIAEMFPFDVNTMSNNTILVLASEADKAKEVIDQDLAAGQQLSEATEVEGTPPEV